MPFQSVKTVKSMAVTFIYALLLLKLCNLSSTTVIGKPLPQVTAYLQETSVATQNPISFSDDALVLADTDHFTHKSSQINDVTNVASLTHRPKRNSLRTDNDGFVRFQKPDNEAIDTNLYASFYDRAARPESNGFIRFGRDEPSPVKSNAFIRLGRGGNKGFMRFGRNKDIKDDQENENSKRMNNQASDSRQFGIRGDRFIRFGRSDEGVAYRNPLDPTDKSKNFLPEMRLRKKSNGLPTGGEHRTPSSGAAPKLVLGQNEIGDELMKHPFQVLMNESTLDEEDPSSQATKDYYNHYYRTNWNNEDSGQLV